MYVTQLYIAFFIIDFATLSLLLNIGNITVGCTRSLKGANLTITLDVYTDKMFASRSCSFYDKTTDYYYAQSKDVFSFTISNDTSVILLKSRAILVTFDGSVNVYEGSANLLTLNAYKWDGAIQASLNASFSDPIQRSPTSIQLNSRNNFKCYETGFCDERNHRGRWIDHSKSFDTHLSIWRKDWYGFVCSTFCKPVDDEMQCSTCHPVTGEQVCCEGIVPGTEDCWRNITGVATTSSSTTANTCKHADLYFWTTIALSCFCITLIVLTAISTTFAFYFYRKYKGAATERYRPYRMNYGMSSDAPQTTHIERQLPNDIWPKDNFSYSYASDDTLDSWPRDVERREARV